MTWFWLAPVWLLGTAAIVVPIAIHLLGRGRGRAVRLGTTRFLEGPESRNLRRLSPSQFPLLAVRCLLLAVLAAVLAGPTLRRAAEPAAVENELLLVDPVLAERFQTGEPPAGTQVRLLAPGFPELQEITAAGGPVASGAGRDVDAWSLAAEAEAKFPGHEIRVLSSGRVSGFRGARPRLGPRVSWDVVPAADADSVNYWIAGLGPPGSAVDGSAQVIVGASSAAGRWFDRRPAVEVLTAESPSGSASRATLTLADGGQVASDDGWSGPGNGPVIAVHLVADPDRATDARHLAAALTVLGRRLPLTLTVDGPLAPAASGGDPAADEVAHLLFWLADEAPEAEALQLRPGGWLVTDGVAPWRSCRGLWAGRRDRVEFARCGRRQGRDDAGAEAPLPLWRLETGEAVLAVRRWAGVRRLEFDSRFHPQWSSLVSSPELLVWLEDLLLDLAGAGESWAEESGGFEAERPASRVRPAGLDGSRLEVLAWEQVRTDSVGEAEPVVGAPARLRRDTFWLRDALWMMLVTLLGLERLLAYRSLGVGEGRGRPAGPTWAGRTADRAAARSGNRAETKVPDEAPA